MLKKESYGLDKIVKSFIRGEMSKTYFKNYMPRRWKLIRDLKKPGVQKTSSSAQPEPMRK